MINYYQLMKPGIIIGNLVTLAAGFILGSGQNVSFGLFFATLIGMTLIIASACIFNNYIDMHLDKKMERTKKRALVTGSIKGTHALVLASVIGVIGHLVLLVFTNLLTLAFAALGFFVYVVFYSFWKSRTVFATAIGSIAGAMPCVVGYTAASDKIDFATCILFMMMVLWQMPHFFAIALFHFDDYSNANIPVLPVSRGIFRTKIHMLVYVCLFMPTAWMLTAFGYTGYFFFFLISFVGIAWIALSIKGFTCSDDVKWGKQMFRLSLIIVTVFCVVIPFDRI